MRESRIEPMDALFIAVVLAFVAVLAFAAAAPGACPPEEVNSRELLALRIIGLRQVYGLPSLPDDLDPCPFPLAFRQSLAASDIAVGLGDPAEIEARYKIGSDGDGNPVDLCEEKDR